MPVVRNQLRVKFAASFNAVHADNAKFYLEPAISKPVFSSIGLFYGVSFARHCRELKRIKGAAGKTALGVYDPDPSSRRQPDRGAHVFRGIGFACERRQVLRTRQSKTSASRLK
jgi:hypothetical protein